MNNESSFTLIEVMVCLVLIGVLVGPFYNLFFSAINFQDHAETKLTLSGQGRNLVRFLDSDIRKAVDVRITEQGALFINTGPRENGFFGGGDSGHDRYVKYYVSEKALRVKLPLNSFAGSGVRYPEWPSEGDMGYGRPLSLSIIKKAEFELREDQMLYYRIVLDGDESKHVLEKEIALPVVEVSK